MLQEIVSVTNIGLVVVDSDLKILLWNKWMEAATGQKADYVLGKRADRYFPDLFTPMLVEKISSSITNHSAAVMPSAVGRLGQRSGPVDVLVHPLSPRKRVHYLNPVSEQVIDDHCLLQFRLSGGHGDHAGGLDDGRLEPDMARLDFLATVGHQIRTPVSGVLNIAELLKETELTGTQKKYVDMLMRMGQSLNTFVGELTDLSYLQAGRAALEKERTDLPCLVQEVLDMFSASGPESSVAAHADLATDLPTYVVTDHQKLRQLLVNIIGNAFKFTSEGSVSVHVAWHRDGEPPKVVFSVTDTGVGIPENRLAALFDRTRPTPAGVSYYNMTGLGLAISQELVDLFGGAMEINSKTGEGTTVKLTIPVEEAEPVTQKGSQVPFQPGQRVYGTWKIMIAEDNPVNQALFKDILGRRGHDVTVVNNGQEAVRAVQVGGPFDVILMDISMPVMDGMEATALIRSLLGAKGQTPILALTAHALEGDRETFLDAGMDGYQSKPVDPDDLQEAIDRAIANRKSKTRSALPRVQEQLARPENGQASWRHYPESGLQHESDPADQ